MSRGPGKIQRAIRELFENEPDGAFTIGDICMRVYPGINRPEKKHRVAVLRALDKMGDTLPGQWGFIWGDGASFTRVYWNPVSLRSYALGRLKANDLESYGRGNTEADLCAQLEPGGKKYDLVRPGGHWHRHVEMERARLAGDTERLAELQAIQDEVTGKTDRRLKVLGAAIRGST